MEKNELKGGGGGEGGAPCYELTSDAMNRVDNDYGSVHSSVMSVSDSFKKQRSSSISGRYTKQTRVEFTLNNTYLGRSGEYMEGIVVVVKHNANGLTFNAEINVEYPSPKFETDARFFLLRNSNVNPNREELRNKNCSGTSHKRRCNGCS